MTTRQVTFPVSPGPRYFIRLHPTVAAAVGNVPLSITLGDRVVPLGFVATGSVVQTPAAMTVSVAAGPPGTPVTFTVDASTTTLVTGVLDAAGNLVNQSVLLPSLTAGAHTVYVRDDSGAVLGQTDFTVQSAPVDYPSSPPVGTPASIPFDAPDIRPVNHWVLYDPAPGGVIYRMPINPSSMTSPHSARVYTSEHSTSPSGQPITFEGGSVAVQWEFSGDLTTQDQYQNLEHFLALNNRIVIADHLRRGWVCTIESVDFTPKNTRTEWAFAYKVKAIIYDGPINIFESP